MGDRGKSRARQRPDLRRIMSAADALADGMALFDRDDRLLHFNRRYVELLPDSAARTIAPGLTWQEWLRAAERLGPVYHAEMGQDAQNRRLDQIHLPASDVEVRPSHGRWCRIRSSLAEGGDRVLLVTDISAERELRQALSNGEARYRAMVEAQSEWVTRMTADDRLTFVNDAYARAIGRPAAALIGWPWHVFGYPDTGDRARHEQHLVALTATSCTR